MVLLSSSRELSRNTCSVSTTCFIPPLSGNVLSCWIEILTLLKSSHRRWNSGSRATYQSPSMDHIQSSKYFGYLCGLELNLEQLYERQLRHSSLEVFQCGEPYFGHGGIHDIDEHDGRDQLVQCMIRVDTLRRVHRGSNPHHIWNLESLERSVRVESP